MSKGTREFIHNKGGVSLWDGVELQRDKLNVNAIAYTQAMDSQDAGASTSFFLEKCAIEKAIRERESITQDDAVALVEHIRDLHLRYPFDGSAYLLGFLAGQCLKLEEGQTAGEVFTAMAMLKAKNPPPAIPEWCGSMKQIINLAVPAELKAAFGVESASWLYDRSEDFARDYARKGCTHGSPASRLFDDGDFAFILDREICSQPEPDSIPVVLAPNEATIAEYIAHAASRADCRDALAKRADYWDALAKAAAILRQNQQPIDGALACWLIEAADRRATRPKGGETATWPKDALRDHAIVEAVAALERCGMRAVTSYREPGPACEVVAQVFNLSPATVRNHWKNRYRTLDRTD